MARLVGNTRPSSLAWLLVALVAIAAIAAVYALVVAGVADQLLARI